MKPLPLCDELSYSRLAAAGHADENDIFLFARNLADYALVFAVGYLTFHKKLGGALRLRNKHGEPVSAWYAALFSLEHERRFRRIEYDIENIFALAEKRYVYRCLTVFRKHADWCGIDYYPAVEIWLYALDGIFLMREEVHIRASRAKRVAYCL